MATPTSPNNDNFDYWNNEGGERWVRYIDRLERIAGAFSPQLLAGADVKAGEHVLDIGCGGGPTSAALAKAAGETGSVLGADISAVILEVAGQRYANLSNLEFAAVDAMTHAFQPAHFDVITSRFGVMFFPDPVAAFKNIRRALKSTARLCIVCWCAADENPWIVAPAAAAFSILPAPEKSPPGAPGPFSLSDQTHAHEMLTAANFSNISFEKIEQTVNMGSIEEALETLCNMGPAASALTEASPADRERALGAMREVLLGNETAEGVILAGAAWLVRADAGG